MGICLWESTPESESDLPLCRLVACVSAGESLAPTPFQQRHPCDCLPPPLVCRPLSFRPCQPSLCAGEGSCLFLPGHGRSVRIAFSNCAAARSVLRRCPKFYLHFFTLTFFLRLTWCHLLNCLFGLSSWRRTSSHLELT